MSFETLLLILGGLAVVVVVGTWLAGKIWPSLFHDDRDEDEPGWLGNEKR
jgi:hypothetical protein